VKIETVKLIVNNKIDKKKNFCKNIKNFRKELAMKFCCPHCGKDDVAAAAAGLKTKCPACQKFFLITGPTCLAAEPVAVAAPIVHKAQIIDDSKNFPKCSHCGGLLYPKTLGPGFLTSLIFNCIMVFGGIILCFIMPFFIIGIPMILIGLFKQPNRRKVLACRRCKAVVDRA